MINEVKMIMDDQTKRTVESLRDAFDELLRPLGKLPGIENALSSYATKTASSIRTATEDLREAVEGLSGKIQQISEKQDAILAGIEEIKSTMVFRTTSKIKKAIPKTRTTRKNKNDIKD
ncbi:MAG: hypothetical protein IJU44_10525 [Kiritimatiellae bacterium]|nr:hypothetical protein [Kiritimatiellia bacterium]